MKCIYCGRPIKKEPEIKVLKGKKHVFCSETCFRFYLYKVPTITYDAMLKMYSLRTVTINTPDFRELIYKEDENG
jgi:hypothetical protein